MNPILVIDSNYIAHRIMFKIGNLSYNEKMTGVIFGFLRSVMDLHERFKPSEMIFCWDSTKSWRKAIYPEYKSNRNKDYTPEERKERDLAYYQFNELQDSILSRIGFANVFRQNGIEADDLIAKIVIDQPTDNGYARHIIVSTDNDLYQLLGLADMFFVDKKTLFTKREFDELYRIAPADWLEVKVLCGDSSDNIPGIKGVGVKTALRYLKGADKRPSLMQAIVENADQLVLNKELMRLPHPKTKPMTVRKSQINMSEFEKVCLENGFQFFLKKEQYTKWANMLI